MKINKERIECCMVRSGIFTSKHLADIAGISPQALCAAKQRGSCSLLTAASLARALGVDVEELLEQPRKEQEQ